MHNPSKNKHKEIYTYKAPWTVNCLHWSQRPGAFRLGITSYIEDYHNKLQIIQLFDPESDFVKIAEVDHSYPCTKLMWSPFKGFGPDLFATSGDFLRIWELVTPDEVMETASSSLHQQFPASEHKSKQEDSKDGRERQVICRSTLANIRRNGTNKKEYCAPLTSFDWNETDASLCVTSSIDTTCTVWDVQTQQAKTHLIAHDKEVFDVAFSKGIHIFASVGADGSVRMFDLRSLEHSTIIYETPSTASPPESANKNASFAAVPSTGPGLLRLSWNKQDPNYIATFHQESSSVLILDIRVPAVPVTELHGHNGCLTSIGWSPHSSDHICTAGYDSQALVWDISHSTKQKQNCEPLLSYTAASEINQLSWSSVSPDWVGISHGGTVQALKV